MGKLLLGLVKFLRKFFVLNRSTVRLWYRIKMGGMVDHEPPEQSSGYQSEILPGWAEGKRQICSYCQDPSVCVTRMGPVTKKRCKIWLKYGDRREVHRLAGPRTGWSCLLVTGRGKPCCVAWQWAVLLSDTVWRAHFQPQANVRSTSFWQLKMES